MNDASGAPDSPLLRTLDGRTVLITGAAGDIGRVAATPMPLLTDLLTDGLILGVIHRANGQWTCWLGLGFSSLGVELTEVVYRSGFSSATTWTEKTVALQSRPHHPQDPRVPRLDHGQLDGRWVGVGFEG